MIFEKLLEDMRLPDSPETMRKALNHLKLNAKEDLFVSLAKGHLDVEEVKRALKENRKINL